MLFNFELNRIDVTNKEDWTKIFDHCEQVFKAPVELLINNAGLGPGEEHDPILNVNLHGVMNGSVAFINKYGTSKVQYGEVQSKSFIWVTSKYLGSCWSYRKTKATLLCSSTSPLLLNHI